jgi:hypothetical protein
MKRKLYLLGVIIVLATLVITTSDYSTGSGRTKRTRKTSTSGCSCYTSNSAITGVITTGAANDTVVAGQPYTFTLTITMASGSGNYGVDIAAKTGTLAAISGQGLQLVTLAKGNELTHSTGSLPYSSPKSITFTYTAPAVAGTDTVYANVVKGYSGAWNWVPNKGIKVKLATGVVNNTTPVSYYLAQNFPNPFNPVTKITYGIMKASNVKITVFDLLGREVTALVNEYQTAGN